MVNKSILFYIVIKALETHTVMGKSSVTAKYLGK